MDLPDPEALLVGTGARMRHVKIHTKDEADAPALRDLIAEAVLERRRALDA